MILDIQLERIHPCINLRLSAKTCINMVLSVVLSLVFGVVLGVVLSMVLGVVLTLRALLSMVPDSLLLPFSFPIVLEVESTAMSYASRKQRIRQLLQD